MVGVFNTLGQKLGAAEACGLQYHDGFIPQSHRDGVRSVSASVSSTWQIHRGPRWDSIIVENNPASHGAKSLTGQVPWVATGSMMPYLASIDNLHTSWRRGLVASKFYGEVVAQYGERYLGELIFLQPWLEPTSTSFPDSPSWRVAELLPLCGLACRPTVYKSSRVILSTSARLTLQQPAD